MRVSRDVKTGLGRGVAFVTFARKEDVANGLGLIGQEVDGRLLRIAPCLKNPEKIRETKEQRREHRIALRREKKRKFRETVKAQTKAAAKKPARPAGKRKAVD